MIRGRKVSRPVWALLASSALLCGAVWFVSHRVRPIRWAGDPELVALTAEREQLQQNDNATRDALRAQLQTRMQLGWTEERLAELPAKFGPGWRCALQNAGAGERRLLVTRVNPWITCTNGMKLRQHPPRFWHWINLLEMVQ